MSRRTTLAPGAVLGLALAGVLAGHTLAYRVLEPDAHQRAEVLARSGHGYLHALNALGVAAAVVSVAVLFLHGVLRRPEVARRALLGRLLAFQVSAFLAMEVVERLTAGAGLAHLGSVVLVGVPAQLLVGVAICGSITLIVRAGRAVTGSPREVVRARPADRLASRPVARPRRLELAGNTLSRAPPPSPA